MSDEKALELAICARNIVHAMGVGYAFQEDLEQILQGLTIFKLGELSRLFLQMGEARKNASKQETKP